MLDFFDYMITHFGVPLFFIGLAIILYIGWMVGWKHGDELLGIAHKEKILMMRLEKNNSSSSREKTLKYTKEKEKRANAS